MDLFKSNRVEKIIKIAPPLKLFGAKSEPLTIKTRNLPQSSMMYHFVQESHFTSSLVQIVPHAMQKKCVAMPRGPRSISFIWKKNRY